MALEATAEIWRHPIPSSHRKTASMVKKTVSFPVRLITSAFTKRSQPGATCKSRNSSPTDVHLCPGKVGCDEAFCQGRGVPRAPTAQITPGLGQCIVLLAHQWQPDSSLFKALPAWMQSQTEGRGGLSCSRARAAVVEIKLLRGAGFAKAPHEDKMREKRL